MLPGAGDDIQLKRGIGGRHIRLRHAELAANDVAALRDCTRLVKRDLAVAALPAEPTVARDDELLGGDVFERGADGARDLFRAVGLERSMADCAYANLLRQPAF